MQVKKEIGISLLILLIAEQRKSNMPDEAFEVFRDNPIYAVDTTTIDLCLEAFWWAKFRKHKAAVKLHTVLDIKNRNLLLHPYYGRKSD